MIKYTYESQNIQRMGFMWGKLCDTYNIIMKVDQIEPDIQVSEPCETGSLLQNSRNGFVRKVYSLLSVQLLVTVLFVLPSVLSKSYATFQAENYQLLIISLIGTFVFMIPMVYCKHLTKETPINYILLFGFTICESYSVSLVCSLYTPESVLMAAITTCAATIGLTLYAIQTKSDFTEFTHYLMAFFWSMFSVTFFITLINIFIIRSEILSVLISIGIAAIYSLYLIIDTQLIMGGREKELTMDNYVLGAVILYVDIIRLFLVILRNIGKRND